MNSVQKIISQVMSHYGFRHKYQVAKYFGVTPQALSTWLTNGNIPSRHILKVRSDIHDTELPEPQGSSIEENKTVIDYLINENVRLKNKIAKLNANIYNIRSEKTKDDLFERINSRSLILVGRLFGAFLVGLAAAIYSTKDFSGENIPIVLVVGNACVDLVTTMIFLQASFAETVNWVGFILAGLFFTNFISWLIVIAQYSKAKQGQLSPS